MTSPSPPLPAQGGGEVNFFLSPVHQLEAIDMTEVGEVTEVRTN